MTTEVPAVATADRVQTPVPDPAIETPRFSVSAALDHALKLLDPQISYYGVQIQRDVQIDLPPAALAEKDLIALILSCLALSLQCLRSRTDQRLNLRAVTMTGNQIMLEVRDNGLRLPPDLARDWKSLAPELQALEDHGVSVTLEAPDGEENVSRLFLPAAAIEDTPQVEVLRVLAVDDSEDMLLLYQSLLEHRGYAVDYVNDGYQGLIRLRKTTYALVILDLAMPGVNGALIINAISRELPERLKHLIVVSGCIQDYKELLDANNVAHIQKPFDVDQFYNAIDTRLAELGLGSAVATAR
jgi:CheY-like chemotaxis protein